MAAAATPQARWSAICIACREFGFTRAELQLNGSSFEETLVEKNGHAVWNIDIPLAGEGNLQLTRRFGESQVPTVLVPFAEVLHKHLCTQDASHATAAPVAQPQPNGSDRQSAAAAAQ